MESDKVDKADEERGSAWKERAVRALPVLRWAAQYSRRAALADLVAGVTLGLTLVPQSVAYAALADLPAQHGLYTAFVGTMLYVALGTVKEVSIGPTSLMALLTLQTCRGLPVEFVVLLTFLSGLVVLLMGLLRLGFMVDLISPSVTSGFTSATAVIIAVAQLKGALGLGFVAETVAENASLIWRHRGDVRPPDLLLALGCGATLLLLRKLKDAPVSPKRTSLRRALWLLSISRNALVVVAASATAYCLHRPGVEPLFRLSGTVEPGLPPLGWPPFSATVGNRTVTFVEMVQRLGPSIVMLPLFMVLANIAIAKAFSGGARVDATQEMVTLGLCNMAGSLVQAMPACGAFTRSAVSHASGVRSPAAGLHSGIITLLALVYLTEYFYFIPKACLSAVLICAVIFMVDVASARRLWATSREELGVLALTFCASVAGGVEAGVLCGALASLARLLRALGRAPLSLHSVRVEGAGEGAGEGSAWCATPTLPLVYVSAERTAARLRAHAAAVRPAPLLLDCGRLTLLDQPAAQALERVVSECGRAGQRVVVCNARGEVARLLGRVLRVAPDALRVAAPLALASPASPASPAAPAAPTDEGSALLAAAADGQQDTGV